MDLLGRRSCQSGGRSHGGNHESDGGSVKVEHFIRGGNANIAVILMVVNMNRLMCSRLSAVCRAEVMKTHTSQHLKGAKEES